MLVRVMEVIVGNMYEEGNNSHFSIHNQYLSYEVIRQYQPRRERLQKSRLEELDKHPLA